MIESNDAAHDHALTWDHSSHENFYEYYQEQSLAEHTLERFRAIQKAVLLALPRARRIERLAVADIGCGAGTQAMLWSESGHLVRGLDVNARLLELARTRAGQRGLTTTFEVGSATELPWADRTMDIVLVPELLEHVAPWRQCLNEFARVLKHGGVLYISTSNKLCPVQQEFSLPLYSWYPAFLKRHYERLAVTTRPEIAGYAKYPAVNWFSFFSLERELKALGFECRDRFDMMETRNKSLPVRFARQLIRSVPPLRFLAHVATPYTVVVARKRV